MIQPHVINASHTILFAHKTNYSKDDYRKVVDAELSSGHLPPERADDMLYGAFAFAELNTDENGFNGNWTKAQSYIALGNVLNTLARLGIDSTSMEGGDSVEIAKIFEKELEDGTSVRSLLLLDTTKMMEIIILVCQRLVYLLVM